MCWTKERIAAGEKTSAGRVWSQLAVTLSSNSWVVAGVKVEPLPGQTPRGYHYTLTDKNSVGKPSIPGDYPTSLKA